MQKLINFLIRNHVLFLFLVLQLIAFLFIINSQSYQRSTLFNSSNQIAGSILSAYNEIEKFINLKETNENLAKENAQLRSSLKNSYFNRFGISDTVTDTLYNQRYVYIEAQVTNSSYTYQNNYMSLNRGKRHGIEKGMGVINAEGALGIIKDVSKNFSTVIPIIHTNLSTTGRIKGSNYFGSIKWKGLDHQTVELTAIQKQAVIHIGDTVTTDVRSKAFPTGIPIGIIESSEIEPTSQLYAIEVRLLIDFTSIDHVYVIKDLMKEELQKLEGGNNE